MQGVVILDCDLISSFAKINRIDLLEKLFPDARLVITASVYNELLKTKEYGFDFSDEIIQSDIELINIRKEERSVFEDFLQDYRIYLGEAEGIAIAKCRDGVFMTNDSRAVRFCEEKGVKVLNLKDVLRKIAVDGIVDKGEMLKLIRDIENEDMTFIVGIDDILDEYE